MDTMYLFLLSPFDNRREFQYKELAERLRILTFFPANLPVLCQAIQWSMQGKWKEHKIGVVEF